MTDKLYSLIKKLSIKHSLSTDEYEYLLENYCEEGAGLLAEEAVRIRKEIYGNAVYIRGLIEISNICRNDCLYCGIRRSNGNCERYRLIPDQILACAREGYGLGFRTFVLQGGEDGFYTDTVLGELIGRIKAYCPGCAVTLSLGERSAESYRRLYEAGADRYLLRHETADERHYRQLHPPGMSFQNRMKCLYELKETGYQTGCGFMVGSPYQTWETLAKDLKFIEIFHPDMCGIGPFIPHRDTPFGTWRENPFGKSFGGFSDRLELTCYLLSIIRLIYPPVLLPATTALGTIHPQGKERGILAGANVVMPNLSPVSVRGKYELYDNKICMGEESAQRLSCLERKLCSIGYEAVVDRGDIRYSA